MLWKETVLKTGKEYKVPYIEKKNATRFFNHKNITLDFSDSFLLNKNRRALQGVPLVSLI